jgi:hypothetical protein
MIVVPVILFLVVVFLVCGGLKSDDHGFDPWGI